jgi:hypothetical protein
MAVQCHLPPTDRVRRGTFYNIVHAVTSLRTAHLVANTRDADTFDGMGGRGADDGATVGRLIA